MIDWQRRGRREELDERERGGRPSRKAQTARVELVLERKRDREREGGRVGGEREKEGGGEVFKRRSRTAQAKL